MPYKTVGELPEGTKGLPAHGKEIYMKAFNAAFEQYKDRGDQREALAHATAWAAVKRIYKQVDGKWVARESIGLHKEGSMRLSDGDRRQLLKSALISEYGIQSESPIPKSVQIEEVFDNEIVYNVDGQLYQASYELGENGIAVFSDPKKVLSTKIFKAMESLQSKYSELIRETGRRNAAQDAARIKKIVELCQELLSSEEDAEESKVVKAIKEADSALIWLREQATMKTEDGVQFPADAYAYVPDPEKSTTWKLRLWEDPDRKVTRRQLGAAAAALSPGGFRGQKVQIPSDDLSAVKRKIRAEYRRLDVPDDEIPRWVQESMSREYLLSYIPLTETTFDKGRATVVVIKAGFNADKSRYYPAEMLKRYYKIFEGLKMYADHPTAEEDKALPERSIKPGGWVATLKGVKCDENGTVTGVADIIEDWLMKKLANLRDKDMLSEMGISINAIGHASQGIIEGVDTLIIEKFSSAKSVDFVTEPGAQGIVTLYESMRERDIDLVELATLKERRSDLVKTIEAEVRAEITKEVKRAMEHEERIRELEGQIETLTKDRDDLKEAAEKAERERAKAEAQATIKEAIDKAELPNAAKERILERFKDVESAEGIEDTIRSEIDYIAKLSEAGKVKNLGGSSPYSEKDKEALKESFKRMNPDWTEAQLEIAVMGR